MTGAGVRCHNPYGLLSDGIRPIPYSYVDFSNVLRNDRRGQ